MPSESLQQNPERIIADRLRAEAHRIGFDLMGMCPAVVPPGLSRLDEWLSRGYAGEMRYIYDRRDAYAHPDHIMQGVRSLVMLSVPYCADSPRPGSTGFGRVARYAWGERDYHDAVHEKLRGLAAWLQVEAPGCRARGVVDTAPLMEHEFAQLAGLGWIGKNTLLLNRARGSYFLLAALLTDLELDYDQPHAADHCGTCTACLDACPTSAFPQPYVLDATRCISYLTIENRGPVPMGLRGQVGDWVWGCDICQEVCPWNHHATALYEVDLSEHNSLHALQLDELFWLSDTEFRVRFRRTPMWRARRRGLLRNAAIVLGNQRALPAGPALVHGLQDAEPLVRGACAWRWGNWPRQQPDVHSKTAGKRNRTSTSCAKSSTHWPKPANRHGKVPGGQQPPYPHQPGTVRAAFIGDRQVILRHRERVEGSSIDDAKRRT